MWSRTVGSVLLVWYQDEFLVARASWSATTLLFCRTTWNRFWQYVTVLSPLFEIGGFCISLRNGVHRFGGICKNPHTRVCDMCNCQRCHIGFLPSRREMFSYVHRNSEGDHFLMVVTNSALGESCTKQAACRKHHRPRLLAKKQHSSNNQAIDGVAGMLSANSCTSLSRRAGCSICGR